MNPQHQTTSVCQLSVFVKTDLKLAYKDVYFGSKIFEFVVHDRMAFEVYGKPTHYGK